MNEQSDYVNMTEARKMLGAAVGKPNGVAHSTIVRYETRGLLKSVFDEVTRQRIFLKKDVFKLLEGRKKKIEAVLKDNKDDATDSDE